MSFNSQQLAPTGLDPRLIDLLIDEHVCDTLPRLERLWDYYRNETKDDQTTPQHLGLPQRLLGRSGDGQRREVVIENDIAWRIHAMVDFMFGKPFTIRLPLGLGANTLTKTRASVERGP